MAREDVYHCGELRLHQRRGKCAGGVGPARVADHSALSSDDQLRAWRQSASIAGFCSGRILGGEHGTPGLLEEEASEAHEDGTVTSGSDLRQPDKVENIRSGPRDPQGRAHFRLPRGIPEPPPLPPVILDHAGTFRHAEQLDAWLSSSERQKLLREHDALVSSWSHHRLAPSFAGWFPTDQKAGASPPAWKQFNARRVDALSDRYGGTALSQPIDQRSESGLGHVHRKCA